MNPLMKAFAAIPFPAPVFLLVVTFVYGLLKYFIPSLPLTEEQVSFLLNGLLALLGVVVTAKAARQGILQ